MPWKIIDFGPQVWQLYQSEDGQLFLAVRCQKGFMEFTTLLQLSPRECFEYQALGRVAIDYLGQKVAYWSWNYQDRNMAEDFEAAREQAIESWRTAHPNQFL